MMLTVRSQNVTIRSMHLWPDPKTGPWLVQLRFRFIDGRPECVGIEITSSVEHDESLNRMFPDLVPTRLTATGVREVPFGELVARERQRTAESLREGAADPLNFPQESELMQRFAAEWAEGSKGRGRPREYGPDHWAEVANEYRRALAESDAPTKAVAQRWNVTKSAAAKWVARTRSMGLLPPARKGYPG